MSYTIKMKNGELYHSELYHKGVPGMQWAQDKLKYGRRLTREEYNKLYAKAHARVNGLRANMRGVKRTAQLKGYGQLGAAKALASPYAQRAIAGAKKYGKMIVGATKSGYNQARGAAEGYLNKRRATKNAAAAQERGRSYTSELQRRANAERYKKHQDALAKQREYERMTRNAKVEAFKTQAAQKNAKINSDPLLREKREREKARRVAVGEAKRQQQHEDFLREKFLNRKKSNAKRIRKNTNEIKRSQQHEDFLKEKKKNSNASRSYAGEVKRRNEFLNSKKEREKARRVAVGEAKRRQQHEDFLHEKFLNRKKSNSKRRNYYN